jgi:asparagine N-glycosylation enzyme membrane subunit Stt3
MILLPEPLNTILMIAIIIGTVVQKPPAYVVTGPALGFLAWAFSWPPAIFGIAVLITFIGVVYIIKERA